jgi:glutaminyl-tRNA synthetase
VVELRCTYIPESRSGSDTSGLKVQGTLHWVNIADAVPVEVLEYDRLFKVENPAAEEGDFKDYINADSLKVIPKAYAEPEIIHAKHEERFQFLRKGYFCLDRSSTPDKLVFNRTVTLKDTWVKEMKK